MEIGDFIEVYFQLGLKHKEIVFVLAVRHAYIITERHLKRILKSKGLFRRKVYSNIEKIITFIQQQLQSSGQLHGYRWMHAKCQRNGLQVKKEDVRLILKALDPRGVCLRKARRLHRRNYFARGPNYIWHFDSYDKLKPFGICINGCIDGFSRNIIWLNAFTTSSNPKIVGGYFVEAVERLGGCPKIARGDLGTENVYIRDFQRFLRCNTNVRSAIGSYLDGASTANQRIESWWGLLRRESMEFFISLLTDLKDNGMFDGCFLDKSILQFCFMGIVQDELDETVQVWNSHIIRPSKNDKVPSGRPNIMYLMPELYGTENCLSPIDKADLQLCKTACIFQSTVPCDPDVYELCNIIMVELQLAFPKDTYEALDLYIQLRNGIRASL